MEKKYPVLKCTKELWEEIRPVLESFGIKKDDFFWVKDEVFKNKHIGIVYLISNFGFHHIDKLEFGNLSNPIIDSENSLRYLVNTKEEFLSAVAKLLGKEYNNNNNMEKRNIQIDKETARKWYNGNNKTLKELALQAYKEDELKTLTFYDIFIKSRTKHPYYDLIPHTQDDKWSALHKLAVIAEYLNEGWKPNWNNMSELKYYIFKNEECKDISISHSITWNNGVPIFKSVELAEKAIEIMGDEIRNIFD